MGNWGVNKLNVIYAYKEHYSEVWNELLTHVATELYCIKEARLKKKKAPYYVVLLFEISKKQAKL